MTVYVNYTLLLMIIPVVYGDMTSLVQFLTMGTDFIPINSVELRDVVTPVRSRVICAMYCNQDPQCRTIVFDPPSCRLYESYLNTGSVITSSSDESVVGAVNYDNINLSAAYNQACDHCYLNRYLVCRNGACQCPLNTFWDGQNICLNQLFENSSCQDDSWCRQDLNLTCRCGKCQNQTKTFSEVLDASASMQIFWSFDSNADDLYDAYNGVTMNSAGFVSPGYNGYGSALSLDASQSQYVIITQFLNMTYTSFTWELWTYPTSLANVDNVMVGACESTSTDRCLHMLVRVSSTYFGFFGDDCQGSTIVNINQWHHFAFIYDDTNHTQRIYLNGQLECTRTPAGPFQGYSDTITVGAMNQPGVGIIAYWTGYIDQLSYVSRAKTPIEVLMDATLVAYCSFDNGSSYDSGPNKINGTGVNVPSIAGRVNEGILLNTSQAYFQANGFTLLGASYRSYSVALWIYKLPSTVAYGTIVHLSADSTGDGGWCIPIVGLSSSGQIAAQSYDGGLIAVTGPILSLETWTHIVSSYSAMNGLSLWVNGSLLNSSSPFTYFPSDVPNTITLGSSSNGTSNCTTGPVVAGQFYGIMDELRVYSRELNANDICALANP